MKFNSIREAMEDYLSEVEENSLEKLPEALIDGHTITQLGDLSFLKGCEALGYLSLNKCDLKKLEKFPSGLKLERLELCDNKLHDGLDCLENLDDLEELHIGGNGFDSIEQLKPLSKLKSLRILDATDCPVCEKVTDLHEKIFDLIPSLEAFNGHDKSGESVDFEDGSSDLDDYSSEDSEDSEESSNEGEFDEEDSEDDEDDSEDGDGEDDEEDESDDGGDERPSKSARHE
jgi:Leucine-rich repeat (LRR) protein